jgi:hypothetical protein
MGKKGGAHHRPRPDVAAAVVVNCIVAWGLECGIDLGIYNSKGRSQAASGPGLVANQVLLKKLLAINENLEFAMLPLKAGFIELVGRVPKLNDSQYQNALWAGLKTERVLTLANHLRRIAREPLRFKQAAAAFNGQELAVLKELISLVKVGSCSSSCLMSEEETEATQERPTKKLKMTMSEVSVDSDGFPMMLQKRGHDHSTAASSSGAQKVTKNTKKEAPL